MSVEVLRELGRDDEPWREPCPRLGPHLRQLWTEASHPEATWRPRVDVREEPDRYVVAIDVPGVEVSTLRVTARGGVLTVEGQKNGAIGQYRFGERHHGHFCRSFALPPDAVADALRSAYRDGVLLVTLPRA
jgi:HSP20 family protein